MTRTTTKFGVEYDSLCDLVAFGVAPAVLAYGLVLNQYGRWGWLAAFLYVACGAIRLARFNALPPRDPRFFIGLPIPAAAAALVSPVLFFKNEPYAEGFVPIQAGVMVVIALLMISPLRYRTFKDVAFGRRAYRLLAQDSVGYARYWWYDLEVKAVGDRIVVRQDGVTVFDVVARDHPNGRVGLYSWGNMASLYDDLVPGR